jgi:hypothetical protein
MSSIYALPLQEGEISPNFTTPICANGEGDFDLYTECNGAENGGLYKVTWVNLFASW